MQNWRKETDPYKLIAYWHKRSVNRTAWKASHLRKWLILHSWRATLLIDKIEALEVMELDEILDRVAELKKGQHPEFVFLNKNELLTALTNQPPLF